MGKKYIIIILLVMLLAGCKSKEYTVKIVNSNGELLSSVKVTKGNNITNIAKPEMDGYIFVSWIKDGNFYDEETPVYEDITIEPKFTLIPVILNNYTITFDFGDMTKTQTVQEGKVVDKPKDPKKDKYRFIGWYLDDKLYDFDSEVTGNIILTAKYELARVMVKYELDGGTGVISEEIDRGSKLKRPDEPTKFGYKFIGWYINDKLYNFDMVVDHDITLSAKWEAITYVKVSFDTDGGNIINSQMIPKGNKVGIINNPVKDGYKFLYWSLDDSIFDKEMIINENITLKAVYEKVE